MADGEILSSSYRVQYKVRSNPSKFIDDVEHVSYSDVRTRARALAKDSEVVAVRILSVYVAVFKEYHK
jgi:hypothetical protein